MMAAARAAVLACFVTSGAEAARPPSIIFILSDDLGFGDYSVSEPVHPEVSALHRPGRLTVDVRLEKPAAGRYPPMGFPDVVLPQDPQAQTYTGFRGFA